MGATIHMHIETKLNGEWHHFSAPHIFRDKVFFEMLAGIYEDPNIPKIGPVRGLPKDITFVTKFCYEQDGGSNYLHHESWLNAEEIEKLQKMLYDYGDSHGASLMEYDIEDRYFHTYIDGDPVATHRGWDDVRFIFWFDN